MSHAIATFPEASPPTIAIDRDAIALSARSVTLPREKKAKDHIIGMCVTVCVCGCEDVLCGGKGVTPPRARHSLPRCVISVHKAYKHHIPSVCLGSAHALITWVFRGAT